MFYYGIKLHTLAFCRENQLPFPEQLLITSAAENDLNVFRNALSNIEHRTFFGDKIYHDHDFFERLYETQNDVMMTPVKAIKVQSEWEKQHDMATNDLFSKAVSKVRQSIEGWFSWFKFIVKFLVFQYQSTASFNPFSKLNPGLYPNIFSAFSMEASE